jgi:hypothetical protein
MWIVYSGLVRRITDFLQDGGFPSIGSPNDENAKMTTQLSKVDSFLHVSRESMYSRRESGLGAT